MFNFAYVHIKFVHFTLSIISHFLLNVIRAIQIRLLLYVNQEKYGSKWTMPRAIGKGEEKGATIS